jgi:hypothetical protein
MFLIEGVAYQKIMEGAVENRKLYWQRFSLNHTCQTVKLSQIATMRHSKDIELLLFLFLIV